MLLLFAKLAVLTWRFSPPIRNPANSPFEIGGGVSGKLGENTASVTTVLEFKADVVGSMTLTNTPLEYWVKHSPDPPPIADRAAEIVIGWTNLSVFSP